MRSLVTHHGSVYLWNNFLGVKEADALFVLLRDSIAWQEELLLIYGREVKVPRLVAWYGDSGLPYTYSGVCHRCAAVVAGVDGAEAADRGLLRWCF